MFVSCEMILKNRIGRSVSHQKIYLHIDFHGSCAEFMGQNIKVSKLLDKSSCLPITGIIDNDDVTTEIICHNTGRNNSKIEIVEAYVSGNKEKEVTSFVISFSPIHAFKSSSNNYLRRPLCLISDDVCAKKKVVTFCEDLAVDSRRKGIVNRSQNVVYVMSDVAYKPTTCFDSLSNDVCCSYISPENGICKEYPRANLNYEQLNDNQSPTYLSPNSDDSHKNNKKEKQEPLISKNENQPIRKEENIDNKNTIVVDIKKNSSEDDDSQNVSTPSNQEDSDQDDPEERATQFSLKKNSQKKISDKNQMQERHIPI